MGRSKIQGTPWHYEEDPKTKYKNYEFYSRQQKKRKKQQLEDAQPKLPINLQVSIPGSYVKLKTTDGNECFQPMAHKSFLSGLSVGDKTVYMDKECIVTEILMYIYKQ